MRPEDVLSRERRERLLEFVDLLARWRAITNLISDHDFKNVWERHIEDSINLQRLFPAKRRWLDIGAGAGFPGIVIGVLLADFDGAVVHCIESDSRKCAFLRAAVDTLQIPVRVHNVRAESLSVADMRPIDVVTARAFASVAKILALAETLLSDGAVVALPRGRSSSRDIEDIDERRYTCSVTLNPRDQGGNFLTIEKRARNV